MRLLTLATVLLVLASDAEAADPAWTISGFGVINRSRIWTVETDWFTRERSEDNGLKFARSHTGGGLSLERALGSRWSFRLNTTISSRGFDHRHRSSVTIVFRYLDASLLGQWTALNRKSGRLYAFLGPRFGYRLTDTEINLSIVFPDLRRLLLERAVNWSRWDGGLELGLGAEKWVGRLGLFVHTSYCHGLKDVYSDPPAEPGVNGIDNTWRTIEGRAGISVRLGSW